MTTMQVWDTLPKLFAKLGVPCRGIISRGMLKDISVSGFCLILKHALPVDARLIVQLPGRRRGISLSRAARVLRVESDGESRWLVGCELSSLLSDEEITALRAGCETAAEK